MIQEYVAGFLHNDKEIALVEKNRPEWQAGLLNGIGGKIEETDRYPINAMVREFEEETGVYIPQWNWFLTLEGTESRIYCFATEDTEGWLNQVETTEDEEIHVISIKELMAGQYETVPNVRWIVPLMLQRGNYRPIKVEFYQGTRGTK